MQVLVYWLMRTAMFFAVFGVLWLLHWYDGWAALFALIVAWAISYIAFPGMRLRATHQMDGWINRSHRHIDSDADVEDAEIAADAAAGSGNKDAERE
jgi:hypothetical protein